VPPRVARARPSTVPVATAHRRRPSSPSTNINNNNANAARNTSSLRTSASPERRDEVRDVLFLSFYHVKKAFRLCLGCRARRCLEKRTKQKMKMRR